MEIQFTERELDVMTVLWERGPSTVAEVREELADPLAYNTVLTILRILEKKGYVDHQEEGRAFRYFPLVEREQAGESALGRLMRRFFCGSPDLLLTQLLSARQLSDEEVRRLRDLLEEHIEEQEESR